MKAIIITLLMSSFFCSEMITLKSFSSLSTDTTLNQYLDVSQYQQNDVIHLVIFVVSGKMDKQISYGFYSQLPKVSITLPYKKDTTSSESYCVGDDDDYYYRDRECGIKYYYDIKKVENGKYFCIRITGYTGKDIKYSLLPMSSIAYYIIYAVIIIACIAISCACAYCRWKKARMNNNLLDQKTGQSPMIPQDNQPSNAYY